MYFFSFMYEFGNFDKCIDVNHPYITGVNPMFSAEPLE